MNTMEMFTLSIGLMFVLLVGCFVFRMIYLMWKHRKTEYPQAWKDLDGR